MKVIIFVIVSLLLLASFGEGKLVGKAFPFEVPEATFNVLNYGAKGDGKTDNTKAIQATFEAASGGGTVEFPAGTYVTYPFSFSGSNTVLNLEKGATITAPTDPVNWPGGSQPQPFISASNFKNLGFTGQGTINGQGAAWWGKKSDPRPNLVQLNNIDRLYAQGLTFEDSPNHNLEFYTNFAELDGITISLIFYFWIFSSVV